MYLHTLSYTTLFRSVEDADPSANIAADAGIAPSLTRWPRYAISIEVARDGERALARRELAEDAFDNQRFGGIDLALAANEFAFAREAADHAIAIADRSSREALFDAPAQAAMGFLCKVFEKQRVHRALEPDVQLGDFAFGKRDERHARELQMLVERRDIGLIARHAIERLEIGQASCRERGCQCVLIPVVAGEEK